MEPLVTVMMPARNEERFIRDAIQSIVDQTYQNWELLVVDDQSKDSTRSIAEGFAMEDRRIHVLEGDGICSGNARNKAIREAKGTYIVNMDADDVSAPNRISRLVETAQTLRFPVVGSNLAFVDLDLTVKRISAKPGTDREIRKQMSRWWNRDAVLPQTTLIDAELLRAYQYNEFYHVMVDWDLMIRLSEDERVNFANVQEPLYYYRLNDGSMTLDQHRRIRYNLLVRYNEIRRRKGQPEAQSLEELDRRLHDRPLLKLGYHIAFCAKRAQHGLLLRRHQAISQPRGTKQ
jgi:teichuronic acid biosynthesis glycosyltransferase TuaG